MVVRKFVTALAVSTALVLGTTGCSLSHNIASMQPFAPSDGTQITVDGVKGLNMIYLTKRVSGLDAVEVGALIGSFVNNSGEPVQLRIQYEVDGSEAPDVISIQKKEWVSEIIAPGEKYDIGYNESPAISGIALGSKKTPAMPGELVSIFIAVNDGPGSELKVPALDGSLEQYLPLVDNLAALDEHSGE